MHTIDQRIEHFRQIALEVVNRLDINGVNARMIAELEIRMALLEAYHEGRLHGIALVSQELNKDLSP